MQADQTTANKNPPPSRSRRRLKIALAVVILIVVALGIVWYAVAGKISMSEPYKAVVAQVEKDPQVAERLGRPVRTTWLPPSGSIDGEKASFRFSVAGPKGKASVWAEARTFDGRWGIQLVQVTVPGDERPLSLKTAPAPASGGGDDAPAWTPSAPAAPKAGPGQRSEVSPPPVPRNPKATPEASKSPASGSMPEIQLDLPDAGSPAK